MDIRVLKNDDKYIVFSPESHSLFTVTENIGKILESYESRSGSLPENMSGTGIDPISLLKCFNDTTNCSIRDSNSWAEKAPKAKALCLIISHDCNLQCGYCFADHGKFGGGKKLMSFETAKESIDKFLDENSNNFILFSGGEPFLNYPLMKEVVEYGNRVGLNIKYATITNGTIMNNSIKDFIYKNLFLFQISLDGPKEINDLQRYGGPKSVHDRVLNTLDKLKSETYPLSIKFTITKNSINNLDNIINYLSSLGVSSIGFAEASLLPSDSEFLMSDKEYEDCITELSHMLVRNLNQLASGDKTPIIGPIFDILRSLSTKTRMVNYCSVGRDFISVTADGDVYPCHGFVGMDEFKMGNVHDKEFPGETYANMKDIFGKLNVYTSEECKSCWARSLCGGDCAVYSYVYNNDLSKPTKRKCIMAKSILEALLPEIAEIFQDETKMQNIVKRFSRSRNVSQSLLAK